MRWLAFTVLLCVGCSDGANTQYLPIGSVCSSSGQCGTSPFDCAMSYPGGYCEKPCATDGDCPADSLCAIPPGFPASARACRRRCAATSECRAAEGYTCVPVSSTTAVCDYTGAVDGGLPSG